MTERNLVQGLLFDGANNYLDLGTLGNLGGNLASGVYLNFTLNKGNAIVLNSAFGFQHTNISSSIVVGLNNTVLGGIQFKVGDVAGLFITCHTTNPTLIADGNPHTIILQCDITTKIMSIIVDSANQPITYDSTSTLGTLGNFDTGFNVGALFFNGTHVGKQNCIFSNFKIGTSVSNIYGDYPLTEGSGTTAKDVSGNGNNATLVGSPTWIKRTLVT